MENVKHTPTPWTVRTNRIIGQPDAHEYEPTIATFDRHANATRAVQCVNACADMTDPAAEIARLREIERATNLVWREHRSPGGEVRMRFLPPEPKEPPTPTDPIRRALAEALARGEPDHVIAHRANGEPVTVSQMIALLDIPGDPDAAEYVQNVTAAAVRLVGLRATRPTLPGT